MKRERKKRSSSSGSGMRGGAYAAMTTRQQLLLAIVDTHTTGASIKGSAHAAHSHTKYSLFSDLRVFTFFMSPSLFLALSCLCFLLLSSSLQHTIDLSPFSLLLHHSCKLPVRNVYGVSIVCNRKHAD